MIFHLVVTVARYASVTISVNIVLLACTVMLLCQCQCVCVCVCVCVCERERESGRDIIIIQDADTFEKAYEVAALSY